MKLTPLVSPPSLRSGVVLSMRFGGWGYARANARRRQTHPWAARPAGAQFSRIGEGPRSSFAGLEASPPMNESRSPEGSVRGRAAALLRDSPFLALALVMLAAFLATRIPFFWYSPRVDLSQDSQSYLDVADTMRSGHWPRFIFRTPGYPLLVWA